MCASFPFNFFRVGATAIYSIHNDTEGPPRPSPRFFSPDIATGDGVTNRIPRSALSVRMKVVLGRSLGNPASHRHVSSSSRSATLLHAQATPHRSCTSQPRQRPISFQLVPCARVLFSSIHSMQSIDFENSFRACIIS